MLRFTPKRRRIIRLCVGSRDFATINIIGTPFYSLVIPSVVNVGMKSAQRPNGTPRYCTVLVTRIPSLYLSPLLI